MPADMIQAEIGVDKAQLEGFCIPQPVMVFPTKHPLRRGVNLHNGSLS